MITCDHIFFPENFTHTDYTEGTIMSFSGADRVSMIKIPMLPSSPSR
jgi:hypothetical protein